MDPACSGTFPCRVTGDKTSDTGSSVGGSSSNMASLASLFNHTTRPRGEELFITSMVSPDDEPYTLAPLVRPVIFIGPSLPGGEVTDTMQRALAGYLVSCIGDRLQYLHGVKPTPVGRSVSSVRPSVGQRPSIGSKAKLGGGVWSSKSWIHTVVYANVPRCQDFPLLRSGSNSRSLPLCTRSRERGRSATCCAETDRRAGCNWQGWCSCCKSCLPLVQKGIPYYYSLLR